MPAYSSYRPPDSEANGAFVLLEWQSRAFSNSATLVKGEQQQDVMNEPIRYYMEVKAENLRKRGNKVFTILS